ncbi:MAG: adenylyl-sulfate kinase, partial [Planctomycetes bacterium]|nr:adenylyl-sulfate kinase [Planctomycetota bacterium]
TIWFTGLPCSGKSTLAKMLAEVLTSEGRRVETLDGDEVRQRLTKDLGYSKMDRDENIRRIGYVAKLLSRNGVVVVGATISPYREIRDEVRQEIGRFVEIYVKCDLEVCEARDVKGMYKKARMGEIANFTGVSDPYEPPLTPEITVETDKETAEESLRNILEALANLNYVDRDLLGRVRKSGPAGARESRTQNGGSV